MRIQPDLDPNEYPQQILTDNPNYRYITNIYYINELKHNKDLIPSNFQNVLTNVKHEDVKPVSTIIRNSKSNNHIVLIKNNETDIPSINSTIYISLNSLFDSSNEGDYLDFIEYLYPYCSYSVYYKSEDTIRSTNVFPDGITMDYYIDTTSNNLIILIDGIVLEKCRKFYNDSGRNGYLNIYVSFNDDYVFWYNRSDII